MHTVRTTIEIEVEVEFEAEKFIPAKLDGPPDSWSPAEGGEINILSVKIVDKGHAVGPDITGYLSNVTDELTDAAVNEEEDN